VRVSAAGVQHRFSELLGALEQALPRSLRSAWAQLERSSAARWIFAVIAPSLLLLVAFGFDRAFAKGQVLRGVWVGGVALSGFDHGQAVQALGGLSARLESAPLSIQVRGQPFELDPERVGYHVDAGQSAGRALKVGRNGGFVRQLSTWLGLFSRPVRLSARGTIDRSKLEPILAEWELRALNDRPYDGGLSVRGDRLVPVPPRGGFAVDRAAAERLILHALGRERKEAVSLPLVQVEARFTREAVEAVAVLAAPIIQGPIELMHSESNTLWRLESGELLAALRTRPAPDRPGELVPDLDLRALETRFAELRQRLQIAPQSARFSIDDKDRVQIVPGRVGAIVDTRLVVDALIEAAYARSRVGELPLLRGAPPELTTADAAALGINQLVGKFTTHHACCQPRVHNIHRIADLLDQRIVKPGETFSVNAVVGERTVRNGFVAAPSIEDGEMVDAIGGGISQFATTFFNAVFYGGYDIIERAPHTYYFSRYPMGHEATLSYPKPDIIFKNDSKAGILIDTSYTDASITVKLYGDNGGRRVRAQVSPRFAVVQPEVELIPDETVKPDEEKVDESGMIGWSVHVARSITFADDTTKHEKRKVTYKPRVRRVRVHPCRIPEGEPGHTGEKCPDPEQADAGASPPPAPVIDFAPPPPSPASPPPAPPQ
jgi:vancomycin resistance protein YoaR